MSFFLRHFLILQILQEKKTHIEWIICGAIQRPIFLFCSNHVSHCEWNAFQSAYTFSFFLSLLSKIKLKLIHSVPMYVDVVVNVHPKNGKKQNNNNN